MTYTSFSEIVFNVRSNPRRKRVAVVCAEDQHTLEAVVRARRDEIVDPVLIGDPTRIREALLLEHEDPASFEIVAAASPEASLDAMLAMARRGEVDLIMKGLLQTADLMRKVVSREGGLRTGDLISHVVFQQIPHYPKIVCLTDTAIVQYPDLTQKRQLIENAVGVMRRMGYDLPKVAVLAAVETLNPKMPETVDAAELKGLNQAGELKNCLVEGPISYDLALDPESVAIKGYQSPVAGDADLLVMPNIAAGNILIKCLSHTARAFGGGFVVGAKLPVVLTSRATSALDKYYSLLLASSLN